MLLILSCSSPSDLDVDDVVLVLTCCLILDCDFCEVIDLGNGKAGGVQNILVAELFVEVFM